MTIAKQGVGQNFSYTTIF